MLHFQAGSGIDESTVAIKNGETTISGEPKDAGSYQFTISKDTNIVDGTALSLILTASTMQEIACLCLLRFLYIRKRLRFDLQEQFQEYLESALDTAPIFIKT